MTLSGVLVIDKPAGMTSHDVVGRVRKIFSTRKVGHGGTLDPDVTGVLVLCVGDATRLLEYVTADTKTYEGEVTFGIGTATDDATGETLAVEDASRLTEAMVNETAQRLTGPQEQTVPKFSAVHIDGKRAYELARAGQEVEMPSRSIVIERIDTWGFCSGQKARAHFRVVCSKGTYIRALCRDWGTQVGLPAHMKSLRRVASGRFSIEEAVPLEVLSAAPDPSQYLQSPMTALRDITTVQVFNDEVERFANGQKIAIAPQNVMADCQKTGDHASAACVATQGVIAVLTQHRALVGIAEVLVQTPEKWVLKPKKVFWKREL